MEMRKTVRQLMRPSMRARGYKQQGQFGWVRFDGQVETLVGYFVERDDDVPVDTLGMVVQTFVHDDAAPDGLSATDLIRLDDMLAPDDNVAIKDYLATSDVVVDVRDFPGCVPIFPGREAAAVELALSPVLRVSTRHAPAERLCLRPSPTD